MTGEPLRPGDVVLLGPSATSEMTGAVRVRLDRITHHLDGWAMIDCHEIGERGEVGAQRHTYVLLDGLRPVPAEGPRYSAQGCGSDV